MNFLCAESLGNGNWLVAGETFSGPTKQTENVEFAIRPENLELAQQGISATVRVVEPLGAHVLVTCVVGDNNLFRAVLDSRTAVKAGDKLYLNPQDEYIRWFDTETGEGI